MRFEKRALLGLLAIVAIATLAAFPVHAQQINGLDTAAKPSWFSLALNTGSELNVDQLNRPKPDKPPHPRVIVYSPLNSHCPYCDLTEKWLREHGVAFDSVKTDNFRSFPQTQIGNRRVSGYDTDAFARLLGVDKRTVDAVQTDSGPQRVKYQPPPSTAQVDRQIVYQWRTPYGYTVTRACQTCR